MKSRLSSGPPGPIEAPIHRQIEALKVKIQLLIDAEEARRRREDISILNVRSTSETTEPNSIHESQHCPDISKVQVVQHPCQSEGETKTAHKNGP